MYVYASEINKWKQKIEMNNMIIIQYSKCLSRGPFRTYDLGGLEVFEGGVLSFGLKI